MSTFSARFTQNTERATGPGLTLVVVTMKLSKMPDYLSAVLKTKNPSVFLFLNIKVSPERRILSGE